MPNDNQPRFDPNRFDPNTLVITTSEGLAEGWMNEAGEAAFPEVTTIHPEHDWGQDLHAEVVAKLDELMDAVDNEDGVHIETPSGYPFCGCTDCWVREVLTIAHARFIKESGN